MPPNRLRFSFSAMSLVEVLVAMTLLSIGLLAYFTATSSTDGLARRGDYTASATRIAADKIAGFQASNVSLLPNSTENQPLPDLPGGQAQTVIAPFNNDAGEHFIKQIRVTITWQGSEGREQAGGKVEFFTLVSARK